MPITVGDIVNALDSLGGEAHYQDIANYILENGEAPFPADPAASVRARLQERCSNYQAYKGGADLFASEHGSGIWRFRTYQPPTNGGSALNDNKDPFAGPEDYEAEEGSKKLKEHFVRERDQKLVAYFKKNLTSPFVSVR